MSDLEEAKRNFYDGHEPAAGAALRKALESERGSVVDEEEPVEDDEPEEAPVVPSGNLNAGVVYETPGRLNQR